jgi:lipopolysaccharide assembly outer membrane protein LptD (OstA)
MDLKVNANVTSDDQVFHDYGDRLQERSTQRADTNIFLSYRWDSWSLVGNVLWYQDLTTPRPVELQRVPDIRLRGIRQPVPGLAPLLYEVEASFVNFHRIVGPEGVRVDVHPRLVLPIPVAGFVTLTPSLAGRLTYYDQRLVGQHIALNGGFYVDDSVHDDRVRRQVEFGLQAESRASKVYTLEGTSGIAALQHLIEPRANFAFIRGLDQKAYPQYDPAVSRIGLLQSMDPNIDRLGKVTAVEYVLTNRLNAKTVSGPNQEAVRWEMARFTLAQIYDIGRATANDQPFKDLRGELVYQPTPHIGFRADAAYNVNGLGFREANTDLVASFTRVSALVGSRFSEVGTVNTVHAELAAQVTSFLNVRASTNWDIQNGAAAENRVGFDLRYQCWAIMVEYVDRHGKDNEVRFSVNLLGLGQTGSGFGTGFK